MVSPRQVITSRSSRLTSPMIAAATSHLRQISKKRGTSVGATTAIMRSCDSLIKISSGLSEESRSGTLSRSTFIPPSPAADSSEVAQEMPAAPKSWIPVITPAANSSRVHSISSFSMNGSPTWTVGRSAELVEAPLGAGLPKVSDARIEAPPMPSPPVAAPYMITWLPAPVALARCRSSCRSTPTHSALTSGLPR